MPIKIIEQSDTKIQLELTLPNGTVMAVTLDEHYEIGIQAEIPGTDWKLWVDPLYLDPEDGDGSKVPIVHVYPEKWADSVEGAPVSLESRGEKILLRADDDHCLVRNCPECGGTGKYTSEVQARYGDAGHPCGRCDSTGMIPINS